MVSRIFQEDLTGEIILKLEANKDTPPVKVLLM